MSFDEKSELFLTLSMIFGIHADQKKLDALAVFPGLNESFRYQYAIHLWQKKETGAKFLFIAHSNGVKLEHLKKSPYYLHRLSNVFLQEDAHNTKDQAEWLYKEIASRKKIKNVGVISSFYHFPRAYLSLLKTHHISRNKRKIRFIPLPALPLSRKNNLTRFYMQRTKKEIKKIPAYQKKGDIATLKELEKYIHSEYL